MRALGSWSAGISNLAHPRAGRNAVFDGEGIQREEPRIDADSRRFGEMRVDILLKNLRKSPSTCGSFSAGVNWFQSGLAGSKSTTAPRFSAEGEGASPTAVASISTRAPFGSAATWMVERAGWLLGK